jgi:hypothetical protein
MVHLCKDTSGYVRCEGSYETCAEKFQGACECGVPDEKPSTESPWNEETKPALSCSRCYAVVCGTTVGNEFLCPGNLKECLDKHGRTCRELGCTPGDECTSTRHTCWPPNAERQDSIVCEGSYKECVEKYGKCDCGTPQPICVYNDRKYTRGQSFPAGDGCNTCTCDESGNVACTKIACPAPECKGDADCPTINCIRYPCPPNRCVDGRCEQTDERQYCVYPDQKRAIGESFPAGDGCNTCTCTESGRVVCTERACPVKEECSSDKECLLRACPSGGPCDNYVCRDGVCVQVRAETAT